MINFTDAEATLIHNAIMQYNDSVQFPQANGTSIVRYNLHTSIGVTIASKFWEMVTMDKRSNNEELNIAVTALVKAGRTQTMPAWGYKGT